MVSRFVQTVKTRPSLWFLVGAFAFLYFNLFIFPCTPIFLSGDQSVQLHNAMRMLDGQVMYRDFFHFLPPGAECVYVIAFRLVGVRSWIPHALLVVLGLSLSWLSIQIAKRLVNGPAIYLPALLVLTFAFRGALDATHNWFSALAVMGATALLVEKRNPARLIGAAALCGLAVWFSSVRGVAAVFGIAVFLLWEGRRKGDDWRGIWKSQAYLLGIFFVVVVALNAYPIWQVGLQRFLDCTVRFVLEYYPADSRWNSFRVYMTEVPRFHPWYRLPVLAVWLFIHALTPLIYVLFFVRYRREARLHPEVPWDRLMLLAITGTFLFLGISPAPAWVRLCSISWPALVLLTWFLKSPGNVCRTLLGALSLCALLLAVGVTLETQSRWRAYLDLPSGRTAFLNAQAYNRYEWLSSRTRPGDFFFEAEFLDVYFWLGLRNPAEVPFVTTTDYTRPAQVRNVIQALEQHHVRFVLWSSRLDTHYYGPPAGDHLGPLRVYLRQNFHVVKDLFDNEQVWERKE